MVACWLRFILSHPSSGLQLAEPLPRPGNGGGFFVSGAITVVMPRTHTLFWLIDLNIPLSAIAAALVFFFLKLKKPTGNYAERVRGIDWLYV